MKKVILMMLIASMMLCGCARKQTKEYNLIVIAGNNSCSLHHDYSLLEKYVDKTYIQGGQLSIVSSEGSPRVLKKESIEPISSYATSTQEKSYLSKMNKDIVESLESINPKTEEIDLLESLNVASKTSDKSGDLVCFISGLSTKGLLNMTTLESLSNMSISKTVDNLKACHGLPNLKKIHCIYLYSIGQVADYQKLSPDSVYKLKQFIKEILIASGMKEKQIKFVESNPIDHKAYNAPKVSKVKDNNTGYNAVSISDSYNDIKTKYCKTGIEFQANTANVVDPSKIDNLSSFLKGYDGMVNIYGTTAYDKITSDEDLDKLAYKRAEVIRDSLINEGLRDKINSISSLSYKNIYHKEEWQKDNFNEEIAKLNRTVVIKDSNEQII